MFISRLGTLIFCLLTFAAATFAGPGHDHGPEPAPASAPAVPRLVAEGSELEIVATPKGHLLTIYLDRIATNQPVDGANIEISGDGIASAKATPAGQGVYTLEAEWLDVPGTKALTFVVEADGETDLLAGTMSIPEAHDDHGTSLGWTGLLARPELWLLAITIGLGGFFLSFAFRPVRLPSDDPAPRMPAAAAKPTAVRAVKNAAEIVLVAILFASMLPGKSSAHEGHDHAEDAGVETCSV